VANFTKAYQVTMGHEGGYAKDANDLGGETYRGISRKFNPGWVGWIKVDRAKRQAGFPRSLDRNTSLQGDVAALYKQHYWDKFQGDAIPNQAIADELFDTGVNMGIVRAVEFLQRALNVLNRNQRLYKDLVPDGLFGPKTLAAARAYLRKDRPELLLKIMNVLQGMHYIDFMTKSPIQEKYARGWFKRVDIEKT
jgi:lysozyme family protein